MALVGTASLTLIRLIGAGDLPISTPHTWWESIPVFVWGVSVPPGFYHGLFDYLSGFVSPEEVMFCNTVITQVGMISLGIKTQALLPGRGSLQGLCNYSACHGQPLHFFPLEKNSRFLLFISPREILAFPNVPCELHPLRSTTKRVLTYLTCKRETLRSFLKKRKSI